MKYVILNLTIYPPPYDTFDSIKTNYYNARNISFKNIYNEKESVKHSENEMLYITDKKPDESGRPVMLEKFIWALNLLLKDERYKNCNYFIRTNASTFINLDILDQYINILPKKKCFAGHIERNSEFISGTCIIISRDIAKYLIRCNINKIKYSELDDVALAAILQKKHVRMHNIPMTYFMTNAMPFENQIKDALQEFPLLRIKNSEKNVSIKIWKNISKYFNAQGKPIFPYSILSNSQIENVKKAHKIRYKSYEPSMLKRIVKTLLFRLHILKN